MIPFLSPKSSLMAFALLTEVSSGRIHRWNSLRVLGGSRSVFPRWTRGVRLPELSNCYCHPGRAGGTPKILVSQARWCGYADTQPELGRASETVVGAVDRFATNHSAAAAASSR